PFDEIALLLLGGLVLLAQVVQLLAEVPRQLDKIELFEQLLDRLGAHVGLERFAVLLAGIAILLLIEQLLGLEVGVARVDDDIVLEVDDLLQAGGLHVEEGAQATGHRLEEPDVDDGRRQLDVAHPLAPDPAVGDLDAAAIADHPLVFHAAVLAAGALPVLLRPENPFTEQTILLRPVGQVVDRLGFLDLAEGPRANVVRAGQADPHAAVVVDPVVADFPGTHRYALPRNGTRMNTDWTDSRG